MIALLTLLALTVSSAGIAYLAATDPKRRRAFRQVELTAPRRTVLARIAVFAPGVALVTLGSAGPVVIWAGALTVFGWAIAALSPLHIASIRALSTRVFGRLEQRLSRVRAAWAEARLNASTAVATRLAVRDPADRERIAALEKRVAALEAQLAAESPPTAEPTPIAIARTAS
ncbi:MAG: hypothetical protein AAF415_16725 [Pseudomonadota bacterium]